MDAGTTHSDPFEDTVTIVKGLRSSSFTEGMLVARHAFDKAKAKTAAREIGLHIEAATGLFDQAFSGPEDLSFLPLYYSLLNISKSYIIASGQGSALMSNQLHGASYPVLDPFTSLLQEKIILWPAGVIPLFYSTLTGLVAPWSQKTPISLEAVYPLIYGVTYELEYCCGRLPSLARIDISVYSDEKGPYGLCQFVDPPAPYAVKDSEISSTSYPFLSPFTQVGPRKFRLPDVGEKDLPSAMAKTRPFVNTWMFYELAHSPLDIVTCIPRLIQGVIFPEELPILLASFHLSSVVRYKTEALAALKDSAEWPMLLALRKHATYRFLLLFLSFMRQQWIHWCLQ